MAAVLFVCTANRIRSPLAAASLRRALGDLPIEVNSAGTMGTSPMGAIPEAAVAAERLGLDLSQHSSRALSEVDPGEFDLVIGFELDHLAAAVVERASAPERTFTLKEIVRLGEASSPPAGDEDPERRLVSAVAAADVLRRGNRRFDPADAIPDPVGRGQAAVDACAVEIDSLCVRLARATWGQNPDL